jgi:septal ring factor EnvC (AmiA/AmiB activator)
LFGAQLNKVTYNIIIWFIIVALAFCLSFFVFKFSRSNVLTTQAQENLTDVEQEFDDHKKKSIEREQKVRRQLLDEINKHRNT